MTDNVVQDCSLSTLLLFTVLIFYCGNVFSQQYPVNTLQENGSNENCIDIVFLGDGYTLSELTKFDDDVDEVVEYMFMTSPFKEYKSFFNVYSFHVTSNESGTDHTGTAPDCPYPDQIFERDTYFDTSFGLGTHRNVLVKDHSIVFDFLNKNFPQYDFVFIIVNHEWSGGSGHRR